MWWKILQWLVAVQNLKWKEFSVVGEDQPTSQLVESKKCWKQMQQPFQKLISRSSLFVNLCENWIREIAPNLSTKSWDGYLIVKLEVLSWSINLPLSICKDTQTKAFMNLRNQTKSYLIGCRKSKKGLLKDPCLDHKYLAMFKMIFWQ